jgi:undecaprenyl-diphosphatase
MKRHPISKQHPLIKKNKFIDAALPDNNNVIKEKPINILKIIISGIALTLFSFLLDRSVLALIQSIQFFYVAAFFVIVTKLGEISIFVLLLIILSVIFIINKKRIDALWYAAIASGVLSFIFKMITLRPRPFKLLSEPSIVATSLSSFPSGHAMTLFSILPILEREFPRQKILFWTIAILVALSRLYLKVHYLSDVVAGAFIGYVSGLALLYFSQKHGWKQ